MSSTFRNLIIWIIVIAIIGFVGIEIMSFISDAAEISSGTADQR